MLSVFFKSKFNYEHKFLLLSNLNRSSTRHHVVTVGGRQFVVWIEFHRRSLARASPDWSNCCQSRYTALYYVLKSNESQTWRVTREYVPCNTPHPFLRRQGRFWLWLRRKRELSGVIKVSSRKIPLLGIKQGHLHLKCASAALFNGIPKNSVNQSVLKSLQLCHLVFEVSFFQSTPSKLLPEHFIFLIVLKKRKQEPIYRNSPKSSKSNEILY